MNHYRHFVCVYHIYAIIFGGGDIENEVVGGGVKNTGFKVLTWWVIFFLCVFSFF